MSTLWVHLWVLWVVHTLGASVGPGTNTYVVSLCIQRDFLGVNIGMVFTKGQFSGSPLRNTAATKHVEFKTKRGQNQSVFCEATACYTRIVTCSGSEASTKNG